ncbi:hypothetical protein BG004_002583 [Podila humilis]|nr:hypothetical protein BG004_002583 [Podila humilis]
MPCEVADILAIGRNEPDVQNEPEAQNRPEIQAISERVAQRESDAQSVPQVEAPTNVTTTPMQESTSSDSSPKSARTGSGAKSEARPAPQNQNPASQNPSRYLRHKAVPQVLADMKEAIRRLTTQVDHLSELVRQDKDDVQDSSKTFAQIQTEATASSASQAQYKHRKQLPFKFRGPRKWNTIVTPSQNLDPPPSVDTLDLASSTVSALQEDRVYELFLTRSVMEPLSTGEDALLQLRGSFLQDYVAYTLIDIIESADVKGQMVLVLNRIDVASSKQLLDCVMKKFQKYDIQAEIHIVPRVTLDLGPLCDEVPTKTRLFVTTPEVLPRLKDLKLLNSHATYAMIIYEAEYITQNTPKMQQIKSVLDKSKTCQAVLAVHQVTKDVLIASDMLEFTNQSIVFSMDFENLKNAKHYCLPELANDEQLIARAMELSNEMPVVLICHDGSACTNMRKRVAELPVTMITSTNDLGAVSKGIFLTPSVEASMLMGKAVKGVGLIVNLANRALDLERYLDMMATYMDVGQPCTVVFKMQADTNLGSLRAVGMDIEEIKEEIPF